MREFRKCHYEGFRKWAWLREEFRNLGPKEELRKLRRGSATSVEEEFHNYHNEGFRKCAWLREPFHNLDPKEELQNLRRSSTTSGEEEAMHNFIF